MPDPEARRLILSGLLRKARCAVATDEWSINALAGAAVEMRRLTEADGGMQPPSRVLAELERFGGQMAAAQ